MAGENQNYTLPFGIDPKGFFSNLEAMEKGIDNFQDSAATSIRGVNAAFSDAGKGADAITTKLSKGADAAKLLKERAKEMGKEIGVALSGGSSNGIEEKIKKFQTLMAESAKKGVDIKFNIDDAKLKMLQGKILETSEEMATLNRIVEAGKELLKSFDPNTQAFESLNEQIQLAEGFMQGMEQAAKEVKDATDNMATPPENPLAPVPENAIVKAKTMKQELRELKAELAAMEERGEDGTAMFEKMAIRAGQLEDQIGDTAARIRVLASDTKYLDAGIQAFTAIAGAAAAAQGATALFGAESEEAQKVIQKVTGALAILQGVQAVATALNKDSALSVLLLSRARVTDTAATVAQTTAIEGEVVAANAGTAATNRFTAALLRNPVTLIVVAVVALVAALYSMATASDEAEEKTQDLNDALERQNRLLDLDLSGLKRRTDILVAKAKADGKTEAEILDITKNSLQSELQIRKQHEEDLRILYNNAGKDKVSPEQYKQISAEYNAAIKARQDTETAITVAGYEQIAKVNKKRIEDGKAAVAAAKQRAEEHKKILDQQTKFAVELQNAQAEAIKDETEKEIAIARNATNQKIDALKAETALSKEALETRNKLITQLESNLVVEIAAIRMKGVQSQLQLQYDVAIQTNELRKDGLQKELNLLSLEHDVTLNAILSNVKTTQEQKDALTDALEEGYKAKRLKLIEDFRIESLNKEEQASIDSLDLMTQYSGKSESTERAKQLKILEIQINFAELRLKALTDSGKDENDAEVIAAKKLISNLKTTLKEEGKKGEKVDIFSLLGLDEVFSEEQQAKITSAVQSIMDNVVKVLESTMKQYQNQIDAIKKRMVAEDNEIQELEERIEDEKKLRDKGYANYVGVLEKELDVKKKKREEDAKNLEEYQQKVAKTQRTIAIIQGLVAAVNLVSAASKIFDDYADIPYIGVALAVAAVGAMIASFAATRNSIQATTSASSQFAEGGWIDGPAHSQGGQKYKSIDGKGGVVELEGNEFVVKKSMSQKYGDLVEAINEDFSGMSDGDLAELLAGLGIHFGNEAPGKAVRAVKYLEAHMGNGSGPGPGGDIPELENIDKNIQFLADKKKEEITSWEDNNYYYTRKGNKTTKRPK